MIISHKHKCIFIHVQKTGGMSIESWFRMRDVGAVFDGHRHEIASDAAARTPDWESYFSFGFVRNPWSRLVSWYHMIQENPDAYPHLPFWQYVRAKGPTFRDFIVNCVDAIEDSGTLKSAVRPQSAYLFDGDKQLVSFVGRFETLATDMQYVAEKLSLDPGPLSKVNATRVPKDYRTFYDAETHDLVSARFAEDILRYGYTFDR